MFEPLFPAWAYNRVGLPAAGLLSSAALTSKACHCCQAPSGPGGGEELETELAGVSLHISYPPPSALHAAGGRGGSGSGGGIDDDGALGAGMSFFLPAEVAAAGEAPISVEVPTSATLASELLARYLSLSP